jgi:hypothetical protein
VYLEALECVEELCCAVFVVVRWGEGTGALLGAPVTPICGGAAFLALHMATSQGTRHMASHEQRTMRWHLVRRALDPFIRLFV